MEGDNIDTVDGLSFDTVDGFSFDTVDGFMKHVTKKLKKLSCIPSRRNKGIDEDSNIQWTEPELSSEDFKERTALVTSEEDRYNFKHQKRGLAVIINNWKFQMKNQDGSHHVRYGSKEDAQELVRSFMSLGFDVLCLDNLEDWQMLSLLERVASDRDVYNHSDVDCFACVVLSHGDRVLIDDHEYVDVILGVNWLPNDPKYVKTEKILEIFNDEKCPELKGKPRLFFIQACRGDKLDSGMDISVTTKGIGGLGIQPKAHGRVYGDSQSADAGGKKTIRRDEVDAGKGDEQSMMCQVLPVSPAPLYKDYMVMYATPPGYYAWRSDEGSWFITELCKVLNSNVVYRKSLTTYLSLVCSRVAENYKSNTPAEKLHDGKVVAPVIESMLVKDIVFNRKNNLIHVT